MRSITCDSCGRTEELIFGDDQVCPDGGAKLLVPPECNPGIGARFDLCHTCTKKLVEFLPGLKKAIIELDDVDYLIDKLPQEKRSDAYA